MGEDVERLKRRMPLLEYLRQHNWTGAARGPIRVCRTLSAARRDPAVVLCQHAQKCLLLSRLRPGRRPDSLRPVIAPSVLPSEPGLSRSGRPLAEADSSLCSNRPRLSISSNWITSPDAMRYLQQRGVHDAALIRELGIGYAPGGSLRRISPRRVIPSICCEELGLINAQGADALYQRIVFPLRQDEHIVNLYGRSIGTAFAHRFLPGSKGGLYAWEKVRTAPK